jgi:hypothetical protein
MNPWPIGPYLSEKSIRHTLHRAPCSSMHAARLMELRSYLVDWPCTAPPSNSPASSDSTGSRASAKPSILPPQVSARLREACGSLETASIGVRSSLRTRERQCDGQSESASGSMAWPFTQKRSVAPPSAIAWANARKTARCCDVADCIAATRDVAKFPGMNRASTDRQPISTSTAKPCVGAMSRGYTRYRRVPASTNASAPSGRPKRSVSEVASRTDSRTARLSFLQAWLRQVFDQRTKYARYLKAKLFEVSLSRFADGSEFSLGERPKQRVHSLHDDP